MPVPMPVPIQSYETQVSNSVKENSSDCSSESGASSGRKTPPLDANAAPFYPRGHTAAAAEQPGLFPVSGEGVSYGQSPLQPVADRATHHAHWTTPDRVPRQAQHARWAAWQGWGQPERRQGWEQPAAQHAGHWEAQGWEAARPTER